MEVVSDERLHYLSRQIAQMHMKGVNRKQLAEIALETLVTKLELERIAQEKSSTKEEKKIKTELRRLADLEKSIVSLYFLGKLRGEDWTTGSFFGSLIRHYPYETEK